MLEWRRSLFSSRTVASTYPVSIGQTSSHFSREKFYWELEQSLIQSPKRLFLVSDKKVFLDFQNQRLAPTTSECLILALSLASYKQKSFHFFFKRNFQIDVLTGLMNKYVAENKAFDPSNLTTIGTIDSVQGQEYDCVIFSLVRSNPKSEFSGKF